MIEPEYMAPLPEDEDDFGGVLDTVVVNYGAANRNAQRLALWQKWYEAQK